MEGIITAKCCSRCDETKPIDNFRNGRIKCKICEALSSRERYVNHREVVDAYLSKKRNERKVKKETELKTLLEQIGEDNHICKCCNEVTLKTNFRGKRKICRNCENEKDRKRYNDNADILDRKKDYVKNRKQTDPIFRFTISQRKRISNALKQKQKKTIEYLGCNADMLFNWLNCNFNDKITFETYGKEWHIDHVIPISRFDLTKESEQLIAFNWRNTSPLSVKENLSKHNRLVSLQIEQHYKKLLEFHTEKNIEMPQEFIDLFAKHLVVPESP